MVYSAVGLSPYGRFFQSYADRINRFGSTNCTSVVRSSPVTVLVMRTTFWKSFTLADNSLAFRLDIIKGSFNVKK